MAGFQSHKQRRWFYGQRYVPKAEALRLKDKHSDKTNHVTFRNLKDKKNEKMHIDSVTVEKAKNGKPILRSVSVRNGKKLVRIIT